MLQTMAQLQSRDIIRPPEYKQAGTVTRCQMRICINWTLILIQSSQLVAVSSSFSFDSYWFHFQHESKSLTSTPLLFSPYMYSPYFYRRKGLKNVPVLLFIKTFTIIARLDFGFHRQIHISCLLYMLGLCIYNHADATIQLTFQVTRWRNGALKTFVTHVSINLVIYLDQLITASRYIG